MSLADPAADVEPPTPSDPDEGRRLYHSPLGLFGFQIEGVARSYYQFADTSEPVQYVLWDTGIGKTHWAMATSAMLFEDDLIDHVVVVAESNKIRDWAEEDFPKFTKISTRLYAGDPARRAKILASPPQALVMTYETGRNDICSFKPRSKAVAGPKMLTEFLDGKRVLIVFDEFTKLKSRTSKLYLSWDYLINRVLRRSAHQPMVAGLTATPIERNPEDHWNVGRLLSPARAGKVEDFYPTYVAAYDQFGTPTRWKNLERADCEPDVTPLSEMFAPITLRKRKTDPDVIEQFPSKVENPPRFVTLDRQHLSFYEAVEETFADAHPREQQSIFGMLRQIAGHPMSLLRSNGKAARAIVETVGEAGLRSLGAAKVDEMLSWAQRADGEQKIIFTFYGQSILPLLEWELRKAGFSVSINHGGMNGEDRQAAQRAFKAGDTEIFLTSDAGARGLNLGVGSALLHYDLPVTYAKFVQRSDRIHRIDSKHPSITIDSLIAADTVEYPLARVMLRRNEWSDQVIEDIDYPDDWDPSEQVLTAADRLAMLRAAKRQAA